MVTILGVIIIGVLVAKVYYRKCYIHKLAKSDFARTQTENYTTIVHFILLIIVLLILSVSFAKVSDLYEAKTEYSTKTDSQLIYSLKNQSTQEIEGSRTWVYGHIESDEVVTYKYCVAERIDGRKVKKIKTLEDEDNDIYIDDSLKTDEAPRLDIINNIETTYYVLKHPERKRIYELFFPLYHLAAALREDKDEYMTSKYVFVIPKGSISYDYDVDTE